MHVHHLSVDISQKQYKNTPDGEDVRNVEKNTAKKKHSLPTIIYFLLCAMEWLTEHICIM